LHFRAEARRTIARPLAANKLGKTDAEAQAYAENCRRETGAHASDVVVRACSGFVAPASTSRAQIRRTMDELLITLTRDKSGK